MRRVRDGMVSGLKDSSGVWMGGRLTSIGSWWTTRSASCNHCGHSIEAWNDGNPYYVDERGRKRYAYHPSSERDLCVGNDSPHICLSCGCKFMVDSRKPISPCPGVSTIVSFPTLNIPW
jgi:hypothetical protein